MNEPLLEERETDDGTVCTGSTARLEALGRQAYAWLDEFTGGVEDFLARGTDNTYESAWGTPFCCTCLGERRLLFGFYGDLGADPAMSPHSHRGERRHGEPGPGADYRRQSWGRARRRRRRVLCGVFGRDGDPPAHRPLHPNRAWDPQPVTRKSPGRIRQDQCLGSLQQE